MNRKRNVLGALALAATAAALLSRQALGGDVTADNLTVTSNMTQTSAGGTNSFAGKVGVKTANPSSALHVYVSSGEAACFGQSGNDGLLVGYISSPQYGYLQGRASGVNYSMVLNPNGGNVGVGTTSPSYPLDVNGDLNIGGQDLYLNGNRRITDSLGGNYTCISPQNNSLIIYKGGPHQSLDVFDGSGSKSLKLTQDSVAAQIYSVGTTNLSLQPASGCVGIGTNSPSATLDVVGTAKIRQGVTYLAPLGDISMTIYTNQP